MDIRTAEFDCQVDTAVAFFVFLDDTVNVVSGEFPFSRLPRSFETWTLKAALAWLFSSLQI